MIRTMDSFTGTISNSVTLHEPNHDPNHDPNSVTLNDPNHDPNHDPNSVTLHKPNHDPNSEILSFYRCLSSFVYFGGLCIDNCLG